MTAFGVLRSMTVDWIDRRATAARFNSLPPGVQLTASKLKIEFHRTADFLGKFAGLAYALDNDCEAISEFIECDSAYTLARICAYV